MTTYSCYKCGKLFNQKGHLDAHLNKKNTCQKCNCNFKTNYAYFNDKTIHISDYIKTKLTSNIKCDKGHELIFANGKIIKPYFRHKHSKDVDNNPMSNFHIEWQRQFPVTEVYYPKIKGQIKSRRADIDINEHNMVRHEAAEALGAIGTSDAEEVLKEYAENSSDNVPDVIKESCIVALDAADYWKKEEF